MKTVKVRTVARNSDADLDDIAARLAIDKHRLDDCLLEQPSLYYHVAAHYTRALARRDTLELDLKVRMADLDQDFRNEAAASDSKITEATIANKVKSAPEIVALQRLALDAKNELDQWTALKEAFQQRSFMLRELVSLYTTQYYEQNLASKPDTRSRDALADKNKHQLGQMRRERRANA